MKFKINGQVNVMLDLELPEGFKAYYYNDSWHGDVHTIHVKVQSSEQKVNE